MGLGLGAAGEQLATFSSIVDGEVFLCLKAGTKHSAVSSQLSAVSLESEAESWVLIAGSADYDDE